MKNKVIILLLAVAFAFQLQLQGVVFAQTVSGPSLAEVKQQGEGEIALVYVETPAFVYKKDGNLTGICIEIMDRFINYMDKMHDVQLSVDYKDGEDFSSYLNMVENSSGGVFGVANTTITEERKERFEFSSPYITNIAVLVTHLSVPTLESLSNTKQVFKQTAYVPKSTTHERSIKNIKLRYLPDLNIVNTQNSWQALDKVIENPGTFSYQDIALFWDYKQQDKPVKRHPAGDQSSEKFGIIMPKGSEWATEFERFFTLGSGFRSTSTYREILIKHLGSDVLSMLEMSAQK